MHAPVDRTCVSSSELIPEPSTTFETVPLTANRQAREQHHRVAERRACAGPRAHPRNRRRVDHRARG